MKRRPKNSTGFTMAEILTSIALFTLFITGIYGILISSMKEYAVVETSVRLQQEACNAQSSLIVALYSSTQSKVIISNNPAGLMFPTAQNDSNYYTFDSSGQLMWQGWVCYYLKSQGNGKYYLIKKLKSITPTSTLGPPPYSGIVGNFANDNTLPELIIARNLSKLEVVKSGNVFNITITTDETNNPKQKNYVVMKTSVTPRN